MEGLYRGNSRDRDDWRAGTHVITVELEQLVHSLISCSTKKINYLYNNI